MIRVAEDVLEKTPLSVDYLHCGYKKDDRKQVMDEWSLIGDPLLLLDECDATIVAESGRGRLCSG